MILTINGGSSTVKYAGYSADEGFAQLFKAKVEGRGAGVGRLGFHGLSDTYLIGQLGKQRGKIILAHLGNGASMAAVSNLEVVDTSMGLTPLGGLVMGTRPGDLDPGLVLHLMREEKKT